MKSKETIRATENRFKQQLTERLKGDKRLSLSCPDFKYPEPLYFYVKSLKTAKSIAIRIDGGDETLRFWDYVDDSYEDEDGVWEKMGNGGFERFIEKLYAVMDNAVDIEFFDEQGMTDDYFAGIVEGGLDEEKAKTLLKKHGKGVRFVFAKIIDFYGENQFVFDRQLKPIRR